MNVNAHHRKLHEQLRKANKPPPAKTPEPSPIEEAKASPTKASDQSEAPDYPAAPLLSLSIE